MQCSHKSMFIGINCVGGELSILELQNVVSGADAAEARLKDKKDLENLKFSWDFSRLDQDVPREEYEVLEKLQPHRSLNELTINSYMGERFPNWIEDQIYSNTVSLKLENCRGYRSIPALGQLPSLKKLYIYGFNNLETLDSEFYGNCYAAKPFGSLEILDIKWMLQWEEWFHTVGEAFPLLREFHLRNCPKLTGDLPAHLPSLIKLIIDGCPDLAVSLPEAPALSDLDLGNSNEMLLNHLPQGLQSLEISGFYHLKSLPPAAFSSTLKSLTIVRCFEVELPMHQEFASLERLTIKFSCYSLQYFPLQIFPNLVRLRIRGCSNLESIFSPDGTIHEFLSLTHLAIIECEKFLGFSDRGLHGLNSLTGLKIEKCQGVVSFPVEGLLPKSLTYLHIKRFDDLETLEPKGFEHLTSLSRLTFWDCPKLKCIPPEGLPASLTYLFIYKCPVLKPRLKRDGGEDRDKLAHISRIFIK